MKCTLGSDRCNLLVDRSFRRHTYVKSNRGITVNAHNVVFIVLFESDGNWLSSKMASKFFVRF